MVIPPVAFTGRQGKGPMFEPRRVTVVCAELTGAPNVTCVVPAGHSSKLAYTF